jgi:hypothetical protein
MKGSQAKKRFISGKAIQLILAAITIATIKLHAEPANFKPPQKMLEDFEGEIKWKRGFFSKGAKGEISKANEKIFEKGYVGKIEFDFEKPNGSVEFWKNVNLSSVPQKIGLWINADRELGIFLRIRDAKGETFQWTRKVKPDPDGEYQYIDFSINGQRNHWGGNNDNVIDLPIKGLGLLINSPTAGAGSLYIDAVSIPFPKKKQAKVEDQEDTGGLPAELELQKLLKKEKGAKRPKTPAKKIVKKPYKVECPIPPPTKNVSDATLPDSVDLDWSLANAWKQETATRGRVCLNGLWKFRPTWTTDKDLPENNSGWGFLKVPGGWPCSHRWGHNPYSFIPIAPKCWDEAIGPMNVNRGNWHYRNRKIGEAIPFDKVKDAWYQREFELPDSWKGRTISLRFDIIEQRARIYVNGKWAGEIFWPDGRVNITDLVKFGKNNTVTVRAFTPAIGVGDGPRGIAGDVFLESSKEGPHISDIYPLPSWRNKNIALKIDFSRLDPYKKYFLEGDFRRNGKVEKSIKSEPFIAADLIEGRKTFFWNWENPALWDFGNGNMYELLLALKDEDGKIVDARLPLEFGFREFYTQGKHFMLNGRKVHFFGEYFREYGRSFANMAPEAVKTFIENFRESGFNLIKFSIYDYNSKLTYYPEEMVRMADKMGMAILFQLPRIHGHKANPNEWEKWRKKIYSIVKRWRNHPSIFFWATDQGTGHYVEALNPKNFAGYDSYVPTRTDFWNKVKLGTQLTEDYINNIDGSRIVLHLGGGNIGKVVSIYPYYNFTEIQEQREHPLFWVKNGSKPLFYSEWGIPFMASFTAHRKNNPYPAKKGIPFKSLQPLFAEFAAITKGDNAYKLDKQAQKYATYLDKIQKEGEGDRRWLYKILYSDKERQNLVLEQNFLTTKDERLRELVPYFRAQEMSGIIPYITMPFMKKQDAKLEDHWLRKTNWQKLQSPGISPDIGIPGDPYSYPKNMMGKFIRKTSNFNALKDTLAPQIAFIGGGPVSITNQDRNYQPGEKISKTLLTVNDATKPLSVKCKWSVLNCEDKTIKSGEEEYTVPSGEVARRLIVFDAPESKASETMELKAEFYDGNGKKFADDAFIFNVIPKPVFARKNKKIILWDKTGKNASELDALNVNYKRVKAKDFPSAFKEADLFIIGRETLDLTTPLTGLAEAFKNGMDTLVMEQTQNVLRHRLGFRTNDPAPRKSWKRSVKHKAFKDLPDNSLAFFRGNSTLLEPYPEYSTEFPYDMAKQAYVDWHGFKVKHCWKWGNTNAVASVVIEKPHTGNFIPLADCGFDLQYTPLLEYFDDKGTMIFCQYDVCGRSKADPAARRLLLNCIDYLLEIQPQKRKNLSSKGGKKTQELLDKLHISMNVPNANEKVALITDVTEKLPEGESTVFSLGLDGKKIKEITGKEINTEKKLVSGGVIESVESKYLNGLGNPDFYWRGQVEIPSIKKTGNESFYGPDGTLVIFRDGDKNKDFIACQFRPDQINYEERPHMKLTYLKTMRLLRQLMTNAGLDSKSPLLADMETPVKAKQNPRWLDSYYINRPEAMDDPYRFQHW